MIDSRGVERAGATDDPVNFVTLFEQELGEITSVLTSNAGDERLFHFGRSVG